MIGFISTQEVSIDSIRARQGALLPQFSLNCFYRKELIR
jgi:hypothetical protein